MCGIGCVLSTVESFDHVLLNTHKDNEIDHASELHGGSDEQLTNASSFSLVEQRICEAIAPRGPNGTRSHTVKAFTGDANTDAGHYISFQASLLALRGSSPVFQPIQDTKGNILSWNGQLYECGLNNDTTYLLNRLSDANSNQSDLYDVFSDLKGPFSFVYYDHGSQKVYFGRDVLGRRSLLYIYNEQTKLFVLSSVACDLKPIFPNNDWRSVSTCGIFCYDIATKVLTVKSWPDIYADANGKKWVLAPRTFIVPTAEDTATFDMDTIANEFLEKLTSAVRKRVTNILNSDNAVELNIGILFSGGIDSVILAALSYLCLREERGGSLGYHIDLLNVSFGVDFKQINNSADRKQSIIAFNELKQLYPDAPFRLIFSDILESELEPVRGTIEKLIYPQSTVIDFNIGSALWFASRGVGYEYDGTDSYNTKAPITSTARVLLCGIGSDEQLGGYKRHKNAFDRTKGGDSEKWNALNNEMDMDVSRLWVRNLGRDDRVISYHGREVRNPFLDEDFVMFVRSIPLWIIANFEGLDENSSGIPGDKKILRLAANNVGLIQTCTFVKRAMQFGSNVAKVSYRKQHADTNIGIKLNNS